MSWNWPFGKDTARVSSHQNQLNFKTYMINYQEGMSKPDILTTMKYKFPQYMITKLLEKLTVVDDKAEKFNQLYNKLDDNAAADNTTTYNWITRDRSRSKEKGNLKIYTLNFQKMNNKKPKIFLRGRATQGMYGIKIGIHKEDLQYMKGDWLNIELKKSVKGTWYMVPDEWEPKPKQQPTDEYGGRPEDRLRLLDMSNKPTVDPFTINDTSTDDLPFLIVKRFY
jgi:hypothetical protein